MTTLVEIAPGHYLAALAAAAWQRAVAAGCPVTITSSYRSPERQAAMHADYLVALARWNRNPVGKKPTYVAAVADSEHVTGNALDLQDPAIAWMRAHPEYGFVFTDSSERWHVAYRFARDQHLTDGTTTPTPLEEDDMTPDQERMLREVHQALGAGGAASLAETETVLGVARTIRGNTTGVPEEFKAVRREIPTAPAVAEAVWGTTVSRSVDGKVQQVATIQELADAKSALLVLLARGSSVDVDEVALAKQLAPLLADIVKTLSDADVARLAKAANDESDRRERARLGS